MIITTTDCILVSSLSSNGKRVLQVDANQFYGESESSLSPAELSKSDISGIDTVDLIPSGAESDKKPSQDLTLHPHFSIDVSVPFVFLGRSQSVDELVRHQVSKYLNFMSVKEVRVSICSSGDVWTIPTDRSRIFSDKNLKLTEKRGLMTLFKSAAQSQSSSVHSTALVGGESQSSEPSSPSPSSSLSAITYLESHNISRREIVLGIIHGVCMYPLPANTMKATHMMERIRLFVSSLDAYEAGCPFLIPTYGNGDIPQSFARMAAVHGATQILGCSLDTIRHELDEGNYVLVDNLTKHLENVTTILHGVSASLLRENDPLNISLDIFMESDDPSVHPIFCITIPHPESGQVRPGVCPPGTCLRHYVRIVSDEDRDKETLTQFMSTDDAIIFKRLFIERSFNRHFDDFFGIESHINRATRSFNELMGREQSEQLPVAPPPTNPFEETTD